MLPLVFLLHNISGTILHHIAALKTKQDREK